MSSIQRLTPIERKILEEIAKAGDKGVIQRELWKKIGIDGREGVRYLNRLEKMGIIRREPIMIGKRRTYRIFLVKEALRERKVEIEVEEEFAPLFDVPCFTCPHLENCDRGKEITSKTCKKLEAWLMRKVFGDEAGSH